MIDLLVAFLAAGEAVCKGWALAEVELFSLQCSSCPECFFQSSELPRRCLSVSTYTNLLWPIDGLLLLVERHQLFESVGLLQTLLFASFEVEQSDGVLLLLLHTLRRCNGFGPVNARSSCGSALAHPQRIASNASVLQLICVECFHSAAWYNKLNHNSALAVFTDPYDRDLLQSGSWAVCERPRITSLRKAALVALRRTILSSSESRKIHDELEAVRGGKRKAHRVAAAGSCRCTKRQGPAQQQRNLELKDIFGWCLTQLSLSCYFELAR